MHTLVIKKYLNKYNFILFYKYFREKFVVNADVVLRTASNKSLEKISLHLSMLAHGGVHLVIA
jgi:predicted patatin/cPLA2 family phospholipase